VIISTSSGYLDVVVVNVGSGVAKRIEIDNKLQIIEF
jgi:hypothetical protein